MKRAAENFLREWLESKNRKPLVIRGARQVGKTWIVRHLAVESKKQLLELNFEKNPQLASIFISNDPREILLRLSAFLNKSIIPQNSLLFLDEVQAVPEIFAKLRWFFEDMPELPVVAAGSLLEFLLNEHVSHMPVGRIGFMYLEPLSYEEFLLAQGHEQLYQYIVNYQFKNTDIPLAIHEQLLMLFKEYITVGGMPEAVASWVNERDLHKINAIHHNLLATYRNDFAKYRGKVPMSRLEEVMMATPRLLGQKFMFSQVNPEIYIKTLKQAVFLLNQAGVCHSIFSSAANGVPLAAEINKKFFKEIFLDVGLCCAALGLSYQHISEPNDITFINKGAIAEQVVGQLLRTIEPYYIEPSLYYWHRDEKGSQAEIDYIIQHGNKVVPIEVKAGAFGTLKSLHAFMTLKKYEKAVKISSALPSILKREYSLISIPFYLCGQIHRLLEA